jgi:hypothetical protein
MVDAFSPMENLKMFRLSLRNALFAFLTVGVCTAFWLGKPVSITADPQLSCVSPDGKTISMIINNPDGTQMKVGNVPWLTNMNVHLAMLNAQHIEPKFSFATSYYCPYGAYREKQV